jgi:hypothetical protein
VPGQPGNLPLAPFDSATAPHPALGRTGDRVGAADEPDVVAEIVEGDLGVRHGRVGLQRPEPAGDGLERDEGVAEVAPDGAVDRLAAGLLVRLGDVDRAGDAPVLAVGRSPGPGRAGGTVDWHFTTDEWE